MIGETDPLPACFAKSKKNAELFSDWWNKRVSPGRAVFTHRGTGADILDEAKINGQTITDARAKIRSMWR